MASIFSPSFSFIIQLVIATTLSILFTIASATSFTIPLIPPLSPESPFYQVNLTQHQQLNHILSQTDYYLNSQSFKTSANKFHLPVTNIPSALFVTKLVLGTPAKTQVLLIDTGSSIIWTQCKRCFNQTPVPIFNPNHSSSYHKVPCGSSCGPPYYECVNNRVCKYVIRYEDSSSSNGPLARETFTFGDRHVEMVFGCGDNIRNITFAGKGISGIVGLSTFHHSLVNQLLSPHHRRFSYCFVAGLNRSGVLKIGEDATIRGSADTIDFVRQEISPLYYLNLIDISVGSTRMQFPRGTFELHRDGSGGCLIDSGAAATHLDEGPFNRVMTEFDQYFRSHGLRRVDSTGLPYCYNYDPHFSRYIKMTFHFDRSVDYVVDIPNMYSVDPEHRYFCVVLKKITGRNIIGAWHQVNKRIVYDLVHKKLHFKHEDCARDA